MECKEFKFLHPTRCMLVGASASGKSTFIYNLLQHAEDLFHPGPPEKIYYCYYYSQPWFQDFENDIHFIHNQLPESVNPEVRNLIICDDLFLEKGILKALSKWFIRGAHHLNTSILFVSQSIFLPNTEYKLISQNADIFILFWMPRGQQNLEILARQIFDKNEAKQFVQTYKKRMNDSSYGYILLDLTPSQTCRIRSHILPSEKPERVYLFDDDAKASSVSRTVGESIA